MDCKKYILPNKLRVLVVPMSSVESATVTVWVRTGSRFEDKQINGISHFIEHMAFKGSRKRPSARAISEAVDSIGGEFNAGTAKEWTHFYIKARSGVIETAFDVLSDMVLNPLLKEEDIKKEKGVIIQEIALYEDNPMFKISDVFENVVYSGSKLSWDISGNAKTVNNIKRSDFLSYRKMHYYPKNMLISVSGKVGEGEIKALTQKYFSALKPKNQEAKKPLDKLIQTKPAVLLKFKKTDQTHIILGYKGSPMGKTTRYAEAILAVVLGGGMSSRLFIEIREKRGLAYSVRTSSDHVMDNGYLATYAGVRTEKVDNAIAIMLKQHYGIADKRLAISKEELIKAKEFLKGHLALALEDTKDVGDFFALEELLLNETRTPEEVFRFIDNVTVDEVYAVAKEYFKPERLNLAVIGPFEDKAKFEKLFY